MEENENKKNVRLFYLTLAVVMTVVVVLVVAASVARRSLPDTDTGLDGSDSGLNQDTQTGIDDAEDALPTFVSPILGALCQDFCDSVPVYSQTMNDYRTHLGVDIEANLGDTVTAVADGVVTNVWNDPFMGTCISIEHSGNATSIYKNLDPVVEEGIIIGASVKSGDVIGAVGESAMNEIAMEPHLHYELKVDNKHVDPKQHISFSKPEADNEQVEENN